MAIPNASAIEATEASITWAARRWRNAVVRKSHFAVRDAYRKVFSAMLPERARA